MFVSEQTLRKDIIAVCHKIWLKGYVAATDGNVSARLGDDRLIITPSGFSKGDLKVEDLIVTDLKGNKIAGKGKASSEINMHIAIYEERSDVKSVVHAHPPKSIAFSIAGLEIPGCVLPEVVVALGRIPTTEYGTPGTIEGVFIVKDLIREYDALLLDRHGTVTVGKDVFTAYYKLEKVEHTAEVTISAKHLGGIKQLSQGQIEKLIDIRNKMGLKERPIECSNCGNCGKDSSKTKEFELITQITKEILKELK